MTGGGVNEGQSAGQHMEPLMFQCPLPPDSYYKSIPNVNVL